MCIRDSFTEKVNQFDDEYPDLKNVAAICVYPNFAAIVKNTLEVDCLLYTSEDTSLATFP